MERTRAELTVMNVERFATHDGPGIRTCVFLKGCPLRCPWCANPETQDSHLPVLFHDARSCVGCRACETACAELGTGAISFADGSFSFDATRCSACAACERACLHEALELQGSVRTVAGLLDLADRDRDYYEVSGGGVTLSGGEPLMFAEGAHAFLAEAHHRGLDTAVETTGNVPRATLDLVEPLVDHFLYDLKHLDDKTLREVTGANARLVCENLTMLARRCPEKINVRIPVIPGFNYDSGTIRSMIDWLHEIGVTRLNLLPYHTLGRDKYRKMGLPYTCAEHMLTDDDLDAYHRYALSLGMESKIGA